MKLSSHQPTDHAPRSSRWVDPVSEGYLRDAVARISVPRHYVAEAENNADVANWIADELESFGLHTSRQGQYGNVLASRDTTFLNSKIIIAAHFDSVPNCPGADDNASAVAALLASAKTLAQAPGVGFIAFNREEDGFLGSIDFVENYLRGKAHEIELVHVLEMVGFRDLTPGSQSLPKGLPIKVRDTGDFIGIIANRDSNRSIRGILSAAAEFTPSLPVIALKVYFGLERFFPDLRRSDHSSFWDKRLPALMWTDTSEFRNPNYHQPTDTPDTLDYPFLCAVTKLLVSCVATHLALD